MSIRDRDPGVDVVGMPHRANIDEGVSRAQFLRRSAALAVSGSVAGAFLQACGSDATTATSGGEPPRAPTGTLSIGLAAPPASLDAGRAATASDYAFVCQVYDPLVRFDDEYSQIEPALVTSWEQSDDARTWTGQLRRGVRFHDGSPLDSATVKANLEYQKRAGGVAAGLIPELDVIDDSDPSVIRLVCKDPAPDLTRNLTYVYMISGRLLRQGADAIGRRPVGTGPFEFVANAGSTIRLRASRAFWEEGPYVAELEIRSVPDAAARVAALQSGDIHVAPVLAPAQAEPLDSDSRVTLVRQRAVWVVRYLVIHVNKPAVRDIRLRQAMYYALDRETLATSVLRGAATPAAGFQPLGTYGESAMAPAYSFDAARARALVQEVGGTPAVRMAGISGFDPALDQAVAGQLEDVGFKVSLDELEEPVFIEELGKSSSKYDLFLTQHGWSNGGPADYYLGFFTTYSHFAEGESRADTDTALRLQTEIATTADGPERIAKIEQLQNLFAETLPYLPLFYQGQIDGVASSVSGYVPSRNNKASTIRNAFLT